MGAQEHGAGAGMLGAAAGWYSGTAVEERGGGGEGVWCVETGGGGKGGGSFPSVEPLWRVPNA